MKNSEQEKLNQQELEEIYNLQDKLVKTMQSIFGESQKKMGRIKFRKWNDTKLAKILNCSNIGRYLQKPNLDDKSQPKQDAFNNLILKVEFFSEHLEKPLNENLNLKKWLKLATGFLIATLLFCGWLWRNSKNEISYQLTNVERHAVMDLYCENIQMKLALEAVKFQSNYQKRVLSDSLSYHLQEFKKRIPTEILSTRNILRRTNLKTENGQPLINIVEENSTNNSIDENFKDLTTAFTNRILPSHTVIEMVTKKVKAAQIKNIKLMDLAIEEDIIKKRK